MKAKLAVTILLFISLLILAQEREPLRCRTGVIEAVELYKGPEPINIKKVFPELVIDSESSFLKIVMLLDAGRKISLYDYVLKNYGGNEKYKCVAVSDNSKFDSENWQIGPFEEEKRVSMLFYPIDMKRIERKEDFLLSFDLPIGYEVPDIKISLKTNGNEKKILERELEAIAKIDLEDEKKNAKIANENSIDKQSDRQNTQGTNEKFQAKIEKISVNPKSFTFYVKKEDGTSLRLCLYGIVPAENEKLHGAVGRALNSKYSGMDVSVQSTGTDRYGRILAKVYSGDKYINKVMIEDGFAFYSWKYAPNDPELQDVNPK